MPDTHDTKDTPLILLRSSASSTSTPAPSECSCASTAATATAPASGCSTRSCSSTTGSPSTATPRWRDPPRLLEDSWLWRASFDVPASYLTDARTRFALESVPGRLLDLPRPGQLLAGPAVPLTARAAHVARRYAAAIAMLLAAAVVPGGLPAQRRRRDHPGHAADGTVSYMTTDGRRLAQPPPRPLRPRPPRPAPSATDPAPTATADPKPPQDSKPPAAAVSQGQQQAATSTGSKPAAKKPASGDARAHPGFESEAAPPRSEHHKTPHHATGSHAGAPTPARRRDDLNVGLSEEAPLGYAPAPGRGPRDRAAAPDRRRAPADPRGPRGRRRAAAPAADAADARRGPPGHARDVDDAHASPTTPSHPPVEHPRKPPHHTPPQQTQGHITDTPGPAPKHASSHSRSSSPVSGGTPSTPSTPSAPSTPVFRRAPARTETSSLAPGPGQRPGRAELRDPAASTCRRSCCRSTRPPGSSTGSAGRCWRRSTRSRPTTAAT